VHVHVKYMAQDNACIMYGILTSPPAVAAIHQSSFRWRAEMACRIVVVVWLAPGTISIGIGIGNGSSGISGMIIGRRGRRVVWRGRGISRSRIFRQPAAARNSN
jgi:hypothetical protein